MAKKSTLPLINCDLTKSPDGNAFSIMAYWRKKAQNAGWADEDIQKVLKEAMSGDYDHLLCTLDMYCK